MSKRQGNRNLRAYKSSQERHKARRRAQRRRVQAFKHQQLAHHTQSVATEFKSNS